MLLETALVLHVVVCVLVCKQASCDDVLTDHCIRFKHNVLVKNDPKIRFYAGAPLVSSMGYRMGSLCIIDRKPRTLDAESCNVLCNFAEIVVRQIEKTTTSLTAQHAMTQQTQRLLRALNCFSEGLMMCQLTATGWKLLYVNDVWVKITGAWSGINRHNNTTADQCRCVLASANHHVPRALGWSCVCVYQLPTLAQASKPIRP